MEWFGVAQGQHDHDTPSGSQQSGRGASKQQALVDKYSILMRKVKVPSDQKHAACSVVLSSIFSSFCAGVTCSPNKNYY
eukprot:1948725-Amphidinium_carterae.1